MINYLILITMIYMNASRFIYYIETLKDDDFAVKVNKVWTVRDVVAHMVGWERECTKVLLEALKTKEAPWFMKTDDYDEFNAKNVNEFKDYPIPELLNEWRRWQGSLDSEIAKIGEDEIRKAEGFDWVLDEGHGGHYNEHFEQIRNALENNKRIAILSRAYDQDVDDYNQGVDPMARVPEDFKKSERFKQFQEYSGGIDTGSNANDIKVYLKPKKGMKFLDIGCCANLVNYRLDKWGSAYYGVDISPKLIKAMKSFAEKNDINIGGLFVAEAVELPFEDNHFDIAASIGVLEYFDVPYIKRALKEMHRVLKPNARAVVDMANTDHPDTPIMNELEEHLGRPKVNIKREDFEEVLNKYFEIVKADTANVMAKYYLKNKI